MILTLTPNPSVDRTIAVATLTRGVVQRATDSRMDPGGKGINVSRALAVNGTDTVAVLPVGGPQGQVMEDLLRAIALPVETVRISQAIRANVGIVEPDGTTTKVNEQGPRMSADEVAALLAAVDRAAAQGLEWLIGCGSLPPGLDGSFYADLVRRGHAVGAKVAIDSSGAPMAAAVAAGPDLIKPNDEELEELVGRRLATLGDVVEACRTLIAGGVGCVVVSLGGKGAVLVTADQVAHARATITDPLSTVGAGDSLLAGYLHALTHGADPATALRTGVAFGSAAVCLPGTEVPTPADVAKIDVEVVDPVDLDLPL
ncbi:1-phosphofructokinase [Arsenicicoccus sp. oral taxon 190]|uniref:1-phosphofructokinase n=1 Tax=Arsenicicoccus sp. oral taxon 190 TaxID=1658671 RepID=UPI00067A16D7|nr:1-phosphofructokinase [Arsenicicoccus sp. oral taxon 190]AKT52023.1 phosphofructokinase [Arsenicicoccus sp. oral taxon 190]